MDAPRITFITPHQAGTSGGAYIIQQMARFMSRAARMNLVAQQEQTIPVQCVNVVASPSLDPDQVPDADVIVAHADCDTHKAFAALPASKGRKWLYLQGFGDKRCNKNIKTGLAFAKKHDYRVLACSRYLMQEAERRGVAARLAAHGLDHETFHPPEGDAPRSPSVAMLTHGAPWKGTEDGLKALELVRKRRPDAEFWLFGGRPVLFKGNFLYNLPREKVARLLREAAVYVCPSWFEGFGLPGLEALACGAGLATTDTGGSREYAVHERTALVSSPRNPEALADNVLRLLEDETLRSQLAAAGVRLARERFKPWPEAAMDALSVLM